MVCNGYGSASIGDEVGSSIIFARSSRSKTIFIAALEVALAI
jgi:hypothetical protein